MFSIFVANLVCGNDTPILEAYVEAAQRPTHVARIPKVSVREDTPYHGIIQSVIS